MKLHDSRRSPNGWRALSSNAFIRYLLTSGVWTTVCLAFGLCCWKRPRATFCHKLTLLDYHVHVHVLHSVVSETGCWFIWFEHCTKSLSWTALHVWNKCVSVCYPHISKWIQKVFLVLESESHFSSDHITVKSHYYANFLIKNTLLKRHFLVWKRHARSTKEIRIHVQYRIYARNILYKSVNSIHVYLCTLCSGKLVYVVRMYGIIRVTVDFISKVDSFLAMLFFVLWTRKIGFLLMNSTFCENRPEFSNCDLMNRIEWKIYVFVYRRLCIAIFLCISWQYMHDNIMRER